MTRHPLARKSKTFARGFSLIEVVIAVSVVGLTFIGIIGLLGLGVANDQISSQQTVATNIAAAVLADLRSTPTYVTTSSRYGLTLPTAPANASTPVSTSTTPLTGSGVTTSTLYFDSSATFISLGGTAPANAAFVANVYLTRIAYMSSGTPQSNDMARIVVAWPALTPSGTAPSGSVDIISQFLIH